MEAAEQLALDIARLNHSIAYRKRFIVYPLKGTPLLQALMEQHANLIEHFSVSPRFFFIGAHGQSGKSDAAEISSLFVQRPFLEESSGTGLVYEIQDKPKLTLIYDEVQRVFGPGGNEVIRTVINSYKRGKKRTILIDREKIRQEFFCPVIMTGRTTELQCVIPPNTMERCIQTHMETATPDELGPLEDWDLDEQEEIVGNSFREQWAEWAARVGPKIKGNRSTVRTILKGLGIHARQRQLFQPLAEVGYLFGDKYFQLTLDAIKEYEEAKNKHVVLEIRDELIADMRDVYNERKSEFLSSEDFAGSKDHTEHLGALNEMTDKQWCTHSRGKPLTQNGLAFLLREYHIYPVHNKEKTQRGYYAQQFYEKWKRRLHLGPPEFLIKPDSSDSSDSIKEGGQASSPPPLYPKGDSAPLYVPSSPSSPSINTTDKGVETMDINRNKEPQMTDAEFDNWLNSFVVDKDETNRTRI